MATRQDFTSWVHDALAEYGGEASIVDVAKHIWAHHETDLRASRDLFYTWQYDMRWAAKRLRDEGRMAAADATPKGIWALKR
ncbi:MAG: hypothetical protein AAF563_04655 [Pseudomonadota bacterium]